MNPSSAKKDDDDDEVEATSHHPLNRRRPLPHRNSSKSSFTSLATLALLISSTYLPSVSAASAAFRSTLSSPSLYSESVNEDTLRSLGISEDEIDSILNDYGQGNNDRLNNVNNFSSNNNRDILNQEEESEEEIWKSKEGWWKDPLAQFEDDDEDGTLWAREGDNSWKESVNSQKNSQQLQQQQQVRSNQNQGMIVGGGSSIKPTTTPFKTKSSTLVRSVRDKFIHNKAGRRGGGSPTSVTATKKERNGGVPTVSSSLMMLPRIGREVLTSSPQPVKIVAAVGLARYVVEGLRWVVLSGKRSGGVGGKDVSVHLMEEKVEDVKVEEKKTEEEEEVGEESENADGVLFEPEAEEEALRRMGYDWMDLKEDEEAEQNEDVEKDVDNSIDQAKNEPTDEESNENILNPRRSADAFLSMSRSSENQLKKEEGGVLDLIFGGRKRVARMNQLQKDMNTLLERFEAVTAEKQTIQTEYESSNRQLQQMQKELNALSETNTYLKTQLRENQQSVSEAVEAERQRSLDDMARVRESLISVLERERRLMRAEVLRESERVRLELKDYDVTTGDEGYDSIGEDGEDEEEVFE